MWPPNLDAVSEVVQVATGPVDPCRNPGGGRENIVVPCLGGPRLLAVTFHAHDPPMLARFWAELLDRSSVGDGHGVLLPGNDTQVGLRFVRSDAERREP